MNRIRLGISTCPNDTFTFHALINRLVDWHGLDFEIELLDIQQLNDGIFADRFDVAKCSFHAALLLADKMIVLPCGSALGYGVGPLLLAAVENSRPRGSDQVTLCPGAHTTASMLFRIFYPDTTRVEQTVFSDIMPRLKNNTADFGVCIHEGRFTWQNEGLALVEDLGTRWEKELNCPLPLGGLVASRSLDDQTICTASRVVQDSLAFAQNSPQEALATMRRHAQEFQDDVLMKHVELYVNQWTVDLGDTGFKALRELSTKAKAVGLVDHTMPDLEVFSIG